MSNANDEGETWKIYHPSVAFPETWRKWLPADLTSVHWYDLDSLKRLLFSHIGASQNGGRDLPLCEFVRQFRGCPAAARPRSCTTSSRQSPG